MKTMIQWSFSSGTYSEGMDIFLETGAPSPDGVKTIGRWHAPGSKYGFHLVEGDPAAVATLAAQWSPLVDLTLTPVIDDDEAKTALTRAR